MNITERRPILPTSFILDLTDPDLDEPQIQSIVRYLGFTLAAWSGRRSAKQEPPTKVEIRVRNEAALKSVQSRVQGWGESAQCTTEEVQSTSVVVWDGGDGGRGEEGSEN